MSLQTERKTLSAMVRLFCRSHHQGEPLCERCCGLLRYADDRLANCSFGDQKPTCRNCAAHCHSPEMRARITEVMRYSGPRMILHHPLMTLRHLFHKRPPKSKGGNCRR